MSENKNSNSSSTRTAVAALAGAAAVGLGYAVYSLFSSGSQERDYCSTSRSSNPPPNSSYRSAHYDTHPKELEKKKKDGPICSICHGDLKGVVRVLKCYHSFHVECVDEWFQTRDVDGEFNKTCPICREEHENE